MSTATGEIDPRMMRRGFHVHAEIDDEGHELEHRRHDMPATRGATGDERPAVLGQDDRQLCPIRGHILDGYRQWWGVLDPLTRRRFLRLLPLVAMGLTLAIAAERAGLRWEWKIHHGAFSDAFSPAFDISRLEIRLPAVKGSPTILVWCVPPYVGLEWPTNTNRITTPR